jgi:hypothetical protein
MSLLHRHKPWLIGICVVLAILITGLGSVVTGGFDDDPLLGKYETGDKEFERYEIGSKIVYFHQRMIGDAIVDGDFIRYQFDKHTEELLDKEIHWRVDLPESLPAVISKEAAEAMVSGDIQSSRLYFISSESAIYPIEPTPLNPCWVARSIANSKMEITVIDAVEGVILGPGVAPPYGGFSLSGAQNLTACTDPWTTHYNNAADWFDTMGYPTERVYLPTEEQIRSHIQSTETAMFYELAHGGYWYFSSSCTDDTYPADIHDWIQCYNPMRFAFIGSCDGMCQTGPNTFSYEFRKGSTDDTVTVGYCGMSTDPCISAWDNSVPWQDALFSYMNAGQTVWDAFNNALADYPMCVDCMRFEGDTDYAVVPVVQRGEFNQPPVADAGLDQYPEQTDAAGTEVTLDGSGSTDDGCMEPLTYTWTWSGGSASGVNPTIVLPLGGPTEITLTVYDGQYSDTDTVDITVVDTTPPEVDAGEDVTVEQTSYDGAPADLPVPVVSDICDPDPDVVITGELAIYPLGETVVTVTATDDSGNVGTDTVSVFVVDTTAPTLECVESTNPSGKETPTGQGKGKGMGQNPSGFYQLFTEDICDPNPLIYIGAESDPYLFGPFESGIVVKFTEAPGAAPECKPIGSVNGKAETVEYHVTLPADPYVTVVDFSGNAQSCTDCLVPGEPK